MRFTKDDDGKWYAVYPEWTGERWELEMVCGADMMLEIAAEGNNVVDLVLSTEKPEYTSDTLEKIRDTPDIGGALYIMKTFHGFEYNIEVWLCHVVEFVFGEIPETIYIA